jgi:molybdopterin synthase catalytic subunit
LTVIRARLLHIAFDPAAALRQFSAILGDDCGAVVTFTGLARGHSKAGKPVDALVLDHHPRLTQPSLDEIACAAAWRFEVSAVDVIHRAGRILPGEAIVWVAAASPNRRAAFEAADYLMDRLKTEAMFWKREIAGDGSSWIESTATDQQDRNRWE